MIFLILKTKFKGLSLTDIDVRAANKSLPCRGRFSGGFL
jgi:hypothetical protein